LRENLLSQDRVEKVIAHGSAQRALHGSRRESEHLRPTELTAYSQPAKLKQI